MKTQLRPYGPTAAVIEVESTADAITLGEWLRAEALPGVVDLVPAARSVLVQCDTPQSLAAVLTLMPPPDTAAFQFASSTEVTIDTVYDGDDLDDVASRLGVGVADVVEMHTAVTYTAAFCGFVPGFTYLTADTPLLALARRGTPRTRVPGGSVAVAAGFTGVYPSSSPGGWNLLGHTTTPMWDPTRARPAFIEPGDTVRFRSV